MAIKQKICVVTGTRAEYGLLKVLIKLVDLSDDFDLQLIVTGSHLSLKHGNTQDEIIADGFRIDQRIDLNLDSDSSSSISNSTAIAINGFSTAFKNLKSDLVVVLGDRYEILGCAIAAMFAGIPLAHIHGGELTEGAMDDAIRHAVTKLSHIHFVANEVYASRVMQLGEDPRYVFNVGGLGIDAIKNLALHNRKTIEKKLSFKFKKHNLLITFHPVTLERFSSKNHMSELFSALDDLHNTLLIFTMPNADMDSVDIMSMIEQYTAKKENAIAFTSLGQLMYLSVVDQVDLVIGNSSSGIIEVPSFLKPTIDIGSRQKGRLKASSIISCDPKKQDILDAVHHAYSASFQQSLAKIQNPYGNGGAAKKIFSQLQKIKFKPLLAKKFFDIRAQDYLQE